MKQKLLILLAVLALTTNATAKIKLGLRGGANITHMSFSGDVMSAKNRTGFCLGPTMKIGLPLGFDIDVSALYNQWEADPEIYYDGACQITDTKGPSLRRKELAVPINLRKGFGLGDMASVFLFAGPQFAWRLGNGNIEEYGLVWDDSSISLNLGLGAMLIKCLELKAGYNVPLGHNGSLDGGSRRIDTKAGGWQIGAAIYF